MPALAHALRTSSNVSPRSGKSPDSTPPAASAMSTSSDCTFDRPPHAAKLAAPSMMRKQRLLKRTSPECARGLRPLLACSAQRTSCHAPYRS
eukprot:354887-Chlamydomonas_euryale.AAC.7